MRPSPRRPAVRRPVLCRPPQRRPALHRPAVRSGVAVLVAVALLAGCSSGGAAAPPGHGTVERVVDGDTILVRLGAARERVRLIGIDTPEVHDPRSPVECFGAEASRQLASLLPPGTAVRLERDVEARDRYDRLLAYVHRASDDLFVNLAMAADGYAAAATYPPNVTRTAAIVAAAADARAGGLGLWGACGGPHVTAG